MAFSYGNIFHLTWLMRDGYIPKDARVLDFGEPSMQEQIDEDGIKYFLDAFSRQNPLAAEVDMQRLMTAAGLIYVNASEDFSGPFDVVMSLDDATKHFEKAHDVLRLGGCAVMRIPFNDRGNAARFLCGLIKANEYEPHFFSLKDGSSRWSPEAMIRPEHWSASVPTSAYVVYRKVKGRVFVHTMSRLHTNWKVLLTDLARTANMNRFNKAIGSQAIFNVPPSFQIVPVGKPDADVGQLPPQRPL